MPKLSIPNVAKLIADCWTNAEEALQQVVRTKYPDRDEETITTLFHGELQVGLNHASDTGQVSSAFLRDLRGTFLTFRESDLYSQVARGLVATVSFHSKEVEKKTGGDLGIVFVRPDVQWMGHVLWKKNDYQRDLLCQAKIFRRNSRWNRIQPKQSKVLRGKLDYAALLLYRYSDQGGDRRELAPFAWQLTRGTTIRQINGWLVSDSFPEPQNSNQILHNLASGRIGTDDPNVIGRDIAPPQRPTLVIKVQWKKPDDPGEKIYIEQISTEARQQQTVVLARG